MFLIFSREIHGHVLFLVGLVPNVISKELNFFKSFFSLFEEMTKFLLKINLNGKKNDKKK